MPQTSCNGFNINGDRVPQRGYITDELTDYALAWLRQRKDGHPYMLFLSQKAAHSDFVPAERHRGRYANETVPIPGTLDDTTQDYQHKPMWLKNQRNGRHGVDFAYNLKDFDLTAYYRRYCETLLAVDVNPKTNIEPVFVSKASLIDVTDPDNPICVAGNLTLLISLTETGDSDVPDAIGITPWNGSELWFSSNWTGTGPSNSIWPAEASSCVTEFFL